MTFKCLVLLVCIGKIAAPISIAADGDRKHFQILETQQINLGHRSIFYHRVVPPNLPEAPPPPAPLPLPALSPEEEAALLRWEQMEHKFIFLSATVYDRRISELRWSDEKREYRVFSNIDFNYFRGFNDFATETASYFFFLGIGNESKEKFNRVIAEGALSASVQQSLRALTQLPPSHPSYVLVEENPASPQNAAAFSDLDALHTHYAKNRRAMEERFRRQEAENAARERWLRENPPVPKDTVIHFWPKKSSRYLSQTEEGPK